MFTISIWSKLDHVTDSDVNNTEEALILLLELLLVKDLNGQNAVFGRFPKN